MLSVRSWPAALLTLARTFGVQGTLLRLNHEVRRAIDLYPGAPRERATAPTPPGKSIWAPDSSALRAAVPATVAVERGDRVVAGKYQAFRHRWEPLPDGADDWHTNPATGFTYIASDPWWRISHLRAEAGDIKLVWEPARFGWAYDLARAYVVTDDARYAEAFFDRFLRWSEANPPFRGVHWSCGQETAIRAIALLHAEACFAKPMARDARWEAILSTTLAASGERIASAIGYAVSQRNNHGISEAAALVALGLRFEGQHRDAERWSTSGETLLNRLILEQFATDGWYVQHSFNYLRLALDQCVVAQQALEARGGSLSPQAMLRVRAAIQLVAAVVEPTSGVVPNYGANDGAFVRPITTCDYRDYRATLTAACAMFGVDMPHDVAVDAEVLAWINRPAPTPSPVKMPAVVQGSSGWAAARVAEVHVFIRAGKYHSRPSHLDALQMCIRVGSREVVVDPGTYSYNAPGIWRNGLTTGLVHNGPLVDDMEPAIKGPRFLWLSWPDAAISEVSETRTSITIVAERGPIVRRVSITGQRVVVEDGFEAPAKSAELVVRWLLHPDIDAAVVSAVPLKTPIESREAGPLGWYAPYYGERVPSTAVEIRSGRDEPRKVVTVFRLDEEVAGEQAFSMVTNAPLRSAAPRN